MPRLHKQAPAFCVGRHLRICYRLPASTRPRSALRPACLALPVGWRTVRLFTKFVWRTGFRLHTTRDGQMPHLERFGKMLPTIALVGAIALLSACSPEPSTPGDEAPNASDAGGAGTGVAGSGAEQGAQGLLAETLAMEPQVRDVVGRLTEACLRNAGLDRFPSQTPAGAAARPAVVAPTISPDLDEAKIKRVRHSCQHVGRQIWSCWAGGVHLVVGRRGAPVPGGSHRCRRRRDGH